MRALTLLALLLLCLTGGYAQGGPDDPGDAHYAEEAYATLDHLDELLDLTEEQYPDVEDQIMHYFAELDENPPADADEEYEREESLRAGLAKHLTEEQLTLLDDAHLFPEPGAEPTDTNTNKKKKKKWFEVLIDDVAEPILRNRREKRERGGGEP